MPYKINERITDIRIAVRGQNLEQFFTDAFLGVMYTMKPAQKFAPEKVEREMSLESIDTTALLVDFLNETFFLAKTNKEFYTHAVFYKIQPTSLRVKIFGIFVESFRGDIGNLDYHDAEVRQLEGGVWETEIVFDK